VRVLKGGRPTYEVAIEERHARGDFTEDVMSMKRAARRVVP
jgi:hypothetical protein